MKELTENYKEFYQRLAELLEFGIENDIDPDTITTSFAFSISVIIIQIFGDTPEAREEMNKIYGNAWPHAVEYLELQAEVDE